MTSNEMSQVKKSLLVALRENKVDKVRTLLTKHPNELTANEEADSAKNRWAIIVVGSRSVAEEDKNLQPSVRLPVTTSKAYSQLGLTL